MVAIVSLLYPTRAAKSFASTQMTYMTAMRLASTALELTSTLLIIGRSYLSLPDLLRIAIFADYSRRDSGKLNYRQSFNMHGYVSDSFIVGAIKVIMVWQD
jgi:hypothetical protein